MRSQQYLSFCFFLCSAFYCVFITQFNIAVPKYCEQTLPLITLSPSERLTVGVVGVIIPDDTAIPRDYCLIPLRFIVFYWRMSLSNTNMEQIVVPQRVNKWLIDNAFNWFSETIWLCRNRNELSVTNSIIFHVDRLPYNITQLWSKASKINQIWNWNDSMRKYVTELKTN